MMNKSKQIKTIVPDGIDICLIFKDTFFLKVKANQNGGG